MIISDIDESQRKAAKVAGLAYLISFAIVVSVEFGIHNRLIVAGNAAETVRRIMAHERLFRIGISGDLIYCTGVVVLLTALYVILKPVSRTLALLAAFLRFIYALMWVLMTLNLFDALRLLSGANSMWAFEAERVQDLARLYLSTRFDYYYVGLLFGSLASTVCGYLWFKSRYIPRALAAFGIVSSAWCVLCTFAFYLFPEFDKVVNLWWFDTPMGIFDIVTSLWLLFNVLSPSRIAETNETGS